MINSKKPAKEKPSVIKSAIKRYVTEYDFLTNTFYRHKVQSND